MRRAPATLVALAFCAVAGLAACSGGSSGTSSSSSNRAACQQVAAVVKMLDAKHPDPSSIQSGVSQAAQAVQGAPDPHLRQLANKLNSAIGSKAKAHTYNFSVAGALSQLQSACQPYLP
jgi:hypothetical protein